MKFTSIEELKNKKYVEAEIPGWDIDDIFKCKLQRVNLLDLAAKGKIPNSLMGIVIDLFNDRGPSAKDEESIKLINEMADLFCELTMVEPSFQEVQEAIGMTTEQKIAIYNFAVKGVRALEPFRKKSENDNTEKHDTDVPQDTVGTNENK